MCFSPEADLVAGVVVTAIGIDALRHVPRRELVPLASLPLVFGVHQLVETFVWWHLRGDVPDCVGKPAAWIYVVMAMCLVPVLVPFAFARIGAIRSRLLATGLVACGIVSAVLLTIGLVRDSIRPEIDGHHIAYHVTTPWQVFTLGLYILAACGPALLANAAPLRLFGATNLLVVALLIWLAQSAVVSLWCVWAAVSSVLINLYVRRRARVSPEAPGTGEPHRSGTRGSP
ncbi:hypothetical protein EFK50_09285 [Nocardioides marmoriginsengisoli]|uniref:DUF998 domain-containing protein n=1 Tax=Nocardioides marmoriginsengisoli TaxID=661483 RepID=A0A3N0CEX7_9ACTN|nr:DUF6629 family protein [Nocardioides marmoriginsengisoli]RNL62010.1 hypothetical protein EFK50_09285 [Nocardioides marmoriginsengisoli]